MKIALIDSVSDYQTPARSGLSDLVWRLAAELQKRDEQVTVFGAYPSSAQSPVKGVKLIAVPQAIPSRRNILTYMKSALILAFSAKRAANFEVFHTQDSVSAAAFCLLHASERTIWHGHSNVYHNSQHQIPWDHAMYQLMKGATRFAARRVARVIALGPSLIPWWERSGVPRQRIAVVPNAIDLPDEPFTCSAFHPQVWTPTRAKLLYIGRLCADKGGYAELIDAVGRLSALLPVGLVIVGDGPLRRSLEGYVRRCGLEAVVEFCGHQPPPIISAAYRCADLVVLPSRGEMMPRVMLEAWANKTAFMAHAVGAIPDYLIDKWNGYLLANLDADYIVMRLQEALINKDLRSLVITEGFNTAKRLTWSYHAELLQEIYQAVGLT